MKCISFQLPGTRACLRKRVPPQPAEGRDSGGVAAPVYVSRGIPSLSLSALTHPLIRAPAQPREGSGGFGHWGQARRVPSRGVRGGCIRSAASTGGGAS